MDKRSKEKPGRALIRLMMTILALAVIALIVYRIATRESLEEQLKFRQPVQVEEPEFVLPDSVYIDQLLYVPVYSHIYGIGGKPYLLETTLSIRNTDMANPIVVSSVSYYNTGGKLVKRHLANPRRLEPLATMEFLVEDKDTTGGSGANFIVEWYAEQEVSLPMIEAVMVSIGDGHSFAFARPAMILRETRR